MDERSEKICAWMVVPGMTFFGLAMIMGMKFIPPLSPQLNAEQITEIYRANALGMRAGAALMLFGGAFLMPFVASMYSAMTRMGGKPKALAATQLISGLLNYAPLYLCSMIFATASFRAERSPEITQALSDLGWFFLVMPTPAFLVQTFALGFAVLRDKSDNPVFPRWVAYFNFWIGILSLPGVLISLFFTGPFAWDGILAFWLPLAVFGPWMIVMLWVVLKAGRGVNPA
ncbi:MAG: hypothetical protein ABWZ40_15075 [Caulobacterales bacterium]